MLHISPGNDDINNDMHQEHMEARPPRLPDTSHTAPDIDNKPSHRLMKGHYSTAILPTYLRS